MEYNLYLLTANGRNMQFAEIVYDAVWGFILISDKSFFPKGGGEYFVTGNIATHIE